MSIEVVVPQLPESVSDATLINWQKKPGDFVNKNENLVDLETDKDIILHNILIDWSDHDDRNVEIEFYRRVDSVETRLDRHCLFRGSVRSGSDSTLGSIEHDPTCV